MTTKDSNLCESEAIWAYETGTVELEKSNFPRPLDPRGLWVRSRFQVLDISHSYTLIFFVQIVTVPWFFLHELRKHLAFFWFYGSPQLRDFGLVKKCWCFREIMDVLETENLKILGVLERIWSFRETEYLRDVRDILKGLWEVKETLDFLKA